VGEDIKKLEGQIEVVERQRSTCDDPSERQYLAQKEDSLSAEDQYPPILEWTGNSTLSLLLAFYLNSCSTCSLGRAEEE
jgi:hypothetical protein